MAKKSLTKKSILCFLVLGLVFVLVLSAGCGGGQAPAPSEPGTSDPEPSEQGSAPEGEVIHLTASCYLPPAHLMSVLMGDMLKEIEELSNGRLKITYAAGGSILTAPKTADGLEQGLADIGLSHIGYTPGRFAVTEILDLPLGYSTSWVGTNVALDFLEKYQPPEWDNFKLLIVDGGTTASINMTKTPIRKLEDFQGKIMRGAGEVADALKFLGATPRDIPMSEVYEAMSKGTIDGLLVGAESLKSFKIADVTKYTTYAPCVGNQYLFWMAMNREKWDSLPADLQEIFSEVSAKYQPESAVGWNLVNVEGFQTAIEQGAEFITLPDEEAARWKEAVEPVIENYVSKMVDKGYSEQEVREWLAFIRERMAYWDEQQEIEGIPSEADI